MSVRVNDLLKLPSLREATVLSGKNQPGHPPARRNQRHPDAA